MNGQTYPIPGGAFQPIWLPPINTQTLVSILIVFVGAVANRIHPQIRSAFVGPIGFFITSSVAFILYQMKYIPVAFAILFFLLSIWSVHLSAKTEGFLNATNTVDWVHNSKRWYVEQVLKEQPAGIQEKDVKTYPVQGASAQSGTSSGTT